MRAVIDTTHYYMILFPDLRLHKNRDRLVELVRNKHKEITGKSCSYETVTRSQRKIWGEGACLPEDSNSQKEWLRQRNQRQTFIQFFGKKQSEV